MASAGTFTVNGTVTVTVGADAVSLPDGYEYRPSVGFASLAGAAVSSSDRTPWIIAGVAVAAQAQAPFAKPEDAIKYRQSALFVMGQHFGRIGAVVKGERPYNKDEVVKNAAIAEQMSSLHWEAFVPGTDKVMKAKYLDGTAAEIAKGAARGGEELLLVKPLTFMNLSGAAISEAVAAMGAPEVQLLLVYDDFQHDFYLINPVVYGNARPPRRRP